MFGQKNEGDDVWFGRPHASLVPNTKLKSIIQKGGISYIGFGLGLLIEVLKRKWLVQLGLGGHNSRIQNTGISARIVIWLDGTR